MIMARIKTTWQARRIRSGILLARGDTELNFIGGYKLSCSPEMDRVILNYAHPLLRKAYFTTRIMHGDK